MISLTGHNGLHLLLCYFCFYRCRFFLNTERTRRVYSAGCDSTAHNNEGVSDRTNPSGTLRKISRTQTKILRVCARGRVRKKRSIGMQRRSVGLRFLNAVFVRFVRGFSVPRRNVGVWPYFVCIFCLSFVMICVLFD